MTSDGTRAQATHRRAWSPWEREFLRQHYPGKRTDEVAAALGRSVGQVYQAADRLGLKKSAAYLASDDACRLRRGNNTGAATRFRKGQEAWNKGLHYQPGGCVKETQFKPGRPAHEARNYVPIGSHRVSKDGYLERKVTDDPSLAPARRWVAVHRLVWMDAHGPVPAGHAVAFLPGRRTTDAERITLDALELVSRAELMRRNTHHQYGPDIGQLVQLRGAITRQINKRAKHEQQDHQ